MAISFGSTSIKDMYYGSTKIKEAYLGSTLVYSALPTGLLYIFRDVDSSGNLTTATGQLESADAITEITTPYLFLYAFANCSGITGAVTFNNLTIIDGNSACQGMFSDCIGITSASFPELLTLNNTFAFNLVFARCTNLASISFPKLTTIDGSYCCSQTFSQCSVLTTATFPALTTISGQSGCSNMFYACFNLETVTFSALTSINNNTIFSGIFSMCRKLTSLSFPALTTTSFGSYINQFSGMFDSNTASTSGTCTVHFPSNLQSTIAGLTGYPTFGGNASRIVLSFDLPSTASPSGCCVAPDSQILYADGSTKRADEVQVGDIIKGYNEATDTFCDVDVLQVRTPIREGLIRITFEDDTYIDITPDHPLFASTGWQAYDLEQARINYHDDIESEITQMVVGSQLLQYGGSYKTVKSIRVLNIEGTLTAYTFDTTNGVDTYISNGCVSHNHAM